MYEDVKGFGWLPYELLMILAHLHILANFMQSRIIISQQYSNLLATLQALALISELYIRWNVLPNEFLGFVVLCTLYEYIA